MNWLDNPVMRREWRERVRSWKFLAAFLTVGGLAALVVLLRWPSIASLGNAATTGDLGGATSSGVTAAVLSQGTMDVFRPLAFGLAATIAALVPAFPATSIVRERRRGTLAMLLQSPLHPFSIYAGKWLVNVAIACALICASLPAIAATHMLGGLSFRSHVLPLLGILVLMVMVFSAVGLWISSRAQSADSALRWTYAAVLAIAVLSLIPSILWTAGSGAMPALGKWLRACSPLSAIQEVLGQGASGGEGILQTSGWLGPFALASGLMIVAAAAATLWELRVQNLEKNRSAGRVTNEQSAGVQWFRRLTFLVDPKRRSSGIPPLVNPVLVKEFRTRKFGRLHWLLRIVALCAIGSLGLTVITATGTVAWGAPRIVAAMVILQLALLLLFGPSLASGLIAGEMESGGWVQLCMTPLKAAKIVTGKVMSVVWTLLLILLATLPGYFAMGYIQPELKTQLIHVVASLLLSGAMILAVSACCSAFQKTTAVATASSYGILLALLAGTFLVWVARDKPFGKEFVETTLMLNPAAAALSEIRMPGFETYQLVPQAWYVSLAITLFCFLLLGFRTWQLTRPK
jgi:ABC-type transport system involved in multi-copper enzyme maturation permease subunit